MAILIEPVIRLCKLDNEVIPVDFYDQWPWTWSTMLYADNFDINMDQMLDTRPEIRLLCNGTLPEMYRLLIVWLHQHSTPLYRVARTALNEQIKILTVIYSYRIGKIVAFVNQCSFCKIQRILFTWLCGLQKRKKDKSTKTPIQPESCNKCP